MTDPSRLGMDGAALDRITSWQDALVAGGHLPFAMTLVSRFGKPAFFSASGFANAGAETADPDPAGPHHLCRLYSMTKPLVAVGLLILYEEGRYQLDEPVWHFLGAAWKKVRQRELLFAS